MSLLSHSPKCILPSPLSESTKPLGYTPMQRYLSDEGSCIELELLTCIAQCVQQ